MGAELHIELTSRNTGGQPFTVGAALHRYFCVGDIAHVDGLQDCHYIDQLDGNQIKDQNNVVRIAQEVDRLYLNTDATCVIHDMNPLHRATC